MPTSVHSGESLFRAIVESSPSAIVVVDPKGNIALVNTKTEQLFSYDRTELIGKPVELLVPPHYRALHITDRAHYHEKPVSRPMGGGRELFGIRKDGTEFPVEIGLSPVKVGRHTIVVSSIVDITERKRIYREQARLAAIVESASLAIVAKNLDGTITSWNKGAELLFGYSAGEAIGKNILILIPPERLQEESTFIQRIKNGERIEGVQAVRVRKDGSRVHVTLAISPVRDEHGKIVGASKIARDVTEEKKISDKIAFQASILSQIHNAVITTDMEGRLVFWNTFAEQLYGWKAEEVHGKKVVDLLIPSDDLQLTMKRQEMIDNTGAWNGRVAHLRKDGTRFPVHAYSALLRNSDGVPIGRNSVVADISDIVSSEKALRAAEERYRTTLENLSEGCQIIDRQWRYTYVNEAAASHGRRSRDELVGRTMMDAYPGIDQTPMFATLRLCMEDRTPRRLENEFRYDDGASAWFDLRIDPVPEGLFILSTDVTNERRLRTELERYKEHLEELIVQRTAQLEAAVKELEAFSYSVSHDLRAPLRAIDGFSRILEEEYGRKLSDDAARFIGIIRSNTTMMAQLIDDLLQLSRTGRTQLRKTALDMKGLALSVFKELEQSSDDHRVSLGISDLPGTEGDYNLMKQVWVNLLSNALKFTSKRAEARVEIGSFDRNGETVYFVKDNGAGFDMEYARKLFGVFQRLHTRDEFEGTGIGLGIVKRIVEKHAGRVWAEGKVNEGATFYFSLPKNGKSA